LAIGDNDIEIVRAEMRQKRSRARRPQPVCKLLQQLVGNGVSEDFIHLFEMIEIDADNGKLVSCAAARSIARARYSLKATDWAGPSMDRAAPHIRFSFPMLLQALRS